MSAFPFSEQLDEVFNDLECARLKALRCLLRVPAPGAPDRRRVFDQLGELRDQLDGQVVNRVVTQIL